MVKKVIDVPDNTVKIHVTFFNEGYGVKDTMLNIGMLEDASTVAKSATVVRRMIELPSTEVKMLEERKRKAGGPQTVPVGEWLDTNASLLATLYDALIITENQVAEWYLGYLELVPEPTENYYVQTDLGVVVNNEYNEGNVNLLNYDVPKDKVIMTEKEADEFVKKLAALNARKVKVEE